MEQPNKAVISEDLEGLMLVMQGMSKLQKKGGGAPATGGPPSILDQAKQAGAQALAPQQQIQQGLPGVIQNLSAANPSVQKNAEQGQVADMAQKVTAQMQRQSQPPGITGLPAGNMQFSEGGIIPYASGGDIDLSTSDIGVGGASAGAPTAALEESPEIATIRAKQREIEALNRGRPDFYKQSIAALEADKQARAEAAAQQQKRQGFEGLMALLTGGAKSGMAGMGEANTQFNKGIVAQQDAARQANLLDAQMRTKLGELEHARQIGDVTNAMKTEADIAGLKRQMEVNAINRAQVAETGRGRVTTAETAANRLRQDAEQAELDRKVRASEQTSRERIAELGLGRQEDKANREEFKIGLAASGIPKRIAELGTLKHLPKHKIEYDAAIKQLDDLAKLYKVPSDFARILANVDGASAASAASAAPAAFVVPPGYRIPPQK